MALARDVEFLFEIGALRHVDRTWKQFLNPDVANNTEHSFRVAWIALTLARYERFRNMEKIVTMALIHDLPESRCGDVNHLTRQYVVRSEDMAARDIFDSTVHGRAMVAFSDEYHARKTKASQIVKDADNLDVELEQREMTSCGHSLGQLLVEHRNALVYPKLFTKSAKKFWKAIANANPHDWHVKSPRNRFNGGDWRTSADRR